MMTRNLLLPLACLLTFAAPAAAQAPKGSPIQAEIAVGFNFPQYRTAEFPGLTAAVAVLRPLSSSVGVGVVAEVDASYVRTSRAAGLRVYRKTGRGSVFAQVLAGSAKGGESGIVHSTGGRVLQPGAGWVLGGRRYAFQIEADYRFVTDGRIYFGNEPGPGQSQSGVRVLTAFTLKLWQD